MLLNHKMLHSCSE